MRPKFESHSKRFAYYSLALATVAVVVCLTIGGIALAVQSGLSGGSLDGAVYLAILAGGGVLFALFGDFSE